MKKEKKEWHTKWKRRKTRRRETKKKDKKRKGRMKELIMEDEETEEEGHVDHPKRKMMNEEGSEGSRREESAEHADRSDRTHNPFHAHIPLFVHNNFAFPDHWLYFYLSISPLFLLPSSS